MLARCLSLLTSLRLTIVLLGLAVILVFVGTLAEVRLGLYQAQEQIFRSFFVYWTPHGSQLRIPVFPGGWLIGLSLLVNLLAAHIKRFKFERKKSGILMIHGGLILLLLGQFVTECMQVDSQMRIPVGASRNYTEDSRKIELAISDVTDPIHASVVAIPQSLLASDATIQPPGLPFTLHVKNYFLNAEPAGPMDNNPAPKMKATQGLGQSVLFTEAGEVKSMDDENKPTALVEVTANNVALGDWTVSTWFSKPHWSEILQRMVGAMLKTPVDGPQTFTVANHTYELALRPVRYYKPYTITLKQFTHELYAGTDIPSNFASKVHLSEPAKGEDRDVLIHMNAPLRYGGETFYQAAFDDGDRVSVLEVVRNPAAITPYVACLLVGAGLIVQFMTHLIGFARKRAKQNATAAAVQTGSPPAKPLTPALAAERRRA